MSPHRSTSGGLIDRTRTVRFTFDGENLSGHAGDTLASALLANGMALIGIGVLTALFAPRLRKL